MELGPLEQPFLLEDLTREGGHLVREIDAEGLSLISHGPSDLRQHVTGTETDLQDPLPRRGSELLEPELLHRPLRVLGEGVVEARDLVVVVADVVLGEKDALDLSGSHPSQAPRRSFTRARIFSASANSLRSSSSGSSWISRLRSRRTAVAR